MILFARRISIIGATVAALSVFCFVRAEWIERHTRWRPLELPIQLVEGFQTEADFFLDFPGSYGIEVRCLWKTPLSEELLSKEIAVSCDLNEGGKAVELGRWTPGTSFRGTRGEFLSATLCDFHGLPSRRYHVSAKVAHSSSALAGTEPALVVRLDPVISKDIEEHIWLLQIAGWVAGSIAICLFAVALIPVAPRFRTLRG